MKLVLHLNPFQFTMLADLVDSKIEELEKDAEYLPNVDEVHDELFEWYSISMQFFRLSKRIKKKLVLNLVPYNVTMLADLVDSKIEDLEEDAEYLPADDELQNLLQEWYNISKEFEF